MKTQWFLYCPDPEDTGGNYTTTEENPTAEPGNSSSGTASGGDNGENTAGGNGDTAGEPANGTPDAQTEPADNSSYSPTGDSPSQPSEENGGNQTSQPSDNTSQESGSETATQTGEKGGSANYEENGVAAPDKEYIEKVLLGSVAIAKGAEVTAILASAEFALESIEPIGGVLEIAEMIHGVWEALELPDRTCGYQGLVYGLMYGVLNMGDPKPNPTWPNLEDAPEHDEKFFEGVRLAKQRLNDGQTGVKRKNLIQLDIGKRGEKAVINNLWQAAISENDRILKSFTIQWPQVGPNG